MSATAEPCAKSRLGHFIFCGALTISLLTTFAAVAKTVGELHAARTRDKTAQINKHVMRTGEGIITCTDSQGKAHVFGPRALREEGPGSNIRTVWEMGLQNGICKASLANDGLK